MATRIFPLLLLLVSLPGPAVAALCDGVGDDTTAIQGQIVSRTPLPAGTCRISSTLTIGSGQALIGQGAPITVLQATDALVSHDIVVMTSGAAWARPMIQGVAILGSTGGANHIGLWATGPSGSGPTGDRYVVRDVWISRTLSLP